MKKSSGFTLVELMVSSAIAAIVLVVAFSLIGNVYFARKKIRVSQNFYSESRFLLEKIVNIARENTIDYDRYFIEVGPDNTLCSDFDNKQGGPDHQGPGNKENDSGDSDTDKTNRQTLGYPNIFYWEVGSVYRNLGGADMNGGADPCSQAFHGTLKELYFINEDRNIQTAIKLDGSNNRIQSSVNLGYDEDDDGIADNWGHYTKWETNTCNIYSDEARTSLLGSALIQNKEQCNQAHNFENISAKKLNIQDFNFTPYPDRDPFLNFRNDDAQVHPNVFLFMRISLNDFEDYGFSTAPEITMQTSASSRVFGDTRKTE